MANLVLEPLEGEAPALPDPLRHLLRLVDAVHLLPLELLQLGRVEMCLSVGKTKSNIRAETSCQTGDEYHNPCLGHRDRTQHTDLMKRHNFSWMDRYFSEV